MFRGLRPCAERLKQAFQVSKHGGQSKSWPQQEIPMKRGSDALVEAPAKGPLRSRASKTQQKRR